jgi:thiol reductant ABC exporter CydD subunit
MWPRRLLADHPRAARWLHLSIALGVVGSLAVVAWLVLLARVIDGVFVDGRDLGSVAPILFAMVALLVVRTATVHFAELTAQRASDEMCAAVRREATTHLVAAGPTALDEERVADVALTVDHGVDSLDAYTRSFLPTAALAGIVPVVVLLTIAVLDPWTTLVLLFAGPMLILLLAAIGARTRSLTERRLAEMGWLSTFYLDMIRGLPTLIAFRRAEDGATTIGQVSRRHGDTTMDVLRTAFQTSLVIEWGATAATALVAVEVSFRLVGDGLSYGTALAVLLLTPEFFVPLRRLAAEYHAGTSGRVALDRLDRLAALPADPTKRGSQAAPTGGAIVLHDVGFRYPGTERAVLTHVDLRVDPGETVAIVGPTGAGKTTTLHLLTAFTTPTRGWIAVGDRRLAELDPVAWRRQVAWVSQRPTLFAGTVAENVALGRPDASPEQIRAALRTAGAEGFVDELPDGLDTPLGERGLRLSGGQRQRLAIARAALLDRPFVLLDEFTANLDRETEAGVVAAVRALLEGRTAVIVAHRPETIAIADRVMTLHEGRLLEGIR